MKKFHYYLKIFCSSYTVSTLLLSVLNLDMEINTLWMLEMAFLCLVITVTMCITDIVTEKFFGETPVWAFVLVGFLIVFAAVFLIGGLWFKFFSFNLENFFLVLGIDLVTYFSVFAIMYSQEKRSADCINKILKNGRKQNGKDN